ncbi:MAG: exodeoxyribonuclease V subunit gamma [Actinomycetota bacterium]
MAASVTAAQSAQQLLPLLAERLRAPLADPFLPDIVVVPTAGTRDWLIEQLGHLLDVDGTGEAILTNVHFWFPNEFNLHAIGTERAADDPWSVKRLRWTLLGLLTADPSLAPGFAEAKSPLATAQRIAELFDRYSVYRPQMPASWAVGTQADPVTPLRPDKQWQYALWHAVHDVIGVSTGERFIAARGHLDPTAVQRALPGRLSVFGLDAYSPAKVSLLGELSTLLDLAVYTVFPASDRITDLRSVELGEELRSHLDLANDMHNPLLRSWSRAGLESMALLSRAFPKMQTLEAVRAPTVLGRLQQSIAHDEPLAIPPHKKSVLENGDGSFEVHLCHGPTRQVEVLRDALLHRLAADPTLHPRDIIVICPDIETYAPLVGPVMGAEFREVVEGDAAGARLQLPIAIIDKTTSTSTPVADAIAALFDAVGNRLELSKVLELLALEPVRRRFTIGEDDFSRVERWLTDLQVHWGIDDTYRAAAPWHYPTGIEAGTWRIAIDRLINGILVQSPEDRETLTGIVGYDDIGGSSIELVGNLASFIDELSDFTLFCSEPRFASEWADTLEALLNTMFDVPFEDRNQLADALDVARELRLHAATSAESAQLGFREISALFAEELDGIRSRSKVWGDVVRVASLSRLRGVPARIVAILGFDDRAFTSGRGNGDDILLDAPRIAERDFHAEERLGLLNLLSAASDAVLITCNGFDVTNNKELPMAVPLAELSDAVASVIAAGPEASGPRPVLIRHARQLTDPVNFGVVSENPNKNVVKSVDGAFTFDPIAAVVARRIIDVAGEQPVEMVWPDYEWDPTEFDRSSLSIETLVKAIKKPAELYMRERMQISLPSEVRSSDDQVGLWPDKREYSIIGSDLVRAKRAGANLSDQRHLRQLMGGVPIGAVGDRFWAKIEFEVAAMLATPDVDFAGEVSHPIEVEVNGAWVIDTIDATDTQVLEIAFSGAHGRHRLRPWLRLALLALSEPSKIRTAVVLTRLDKKAEDKLKKKKKEGGGELLDADRVAVERFVLAGESEADRIRFANTIVQFAIGVHWRALCSPLPLFEYASWADLALSSHVNAGLNSDLKNPSAAAIFGGRTFADFTNAADVFSPLHPIDQDFAKTGTRFQAYARALQECFAETTVTK